MSLDPRIIFSNNLQYYLDINNKSQIDLINDLNLKQSTVSDWINGKKYPRVDKMELLANYFNILKSDLMEQKETPAQVSADIPKETIELAEQLFAAYGDTPISEFTQDDIDDIVAFLQIKKKKKSKKEIEE